MSDDELSRNMAGVLGSLGANPRVQLRTRYLEEVITLRNNGLDDKQIDKELYKKVWKEDPELAEALFPTKEKETAREKALRIMKEKGIDTSDEEEVEILTKMTQLTEDGKRFRKLTDAYSKTPNQHKANRFQKRFNSIFGITIFGFISGWILWGVVTFSLFYSRTIRASSDEAGFAWIFLPPIFLLVLSAWVRKFILRK